jgi:uncharacterized protein YqeY
MSLREKIQIDFKEAFKGKEGIRLSVLKILQAEIHNAEIAKRTKLGKESPLNDEEILQVISREIKKRKDAVEMYGKGGRKELAEKEKKEAEILSAYLPEQMPEEEIRVLVQKAVKQSGLPAQAGATGQKEIGKVMAVLMPQVKGRADGSLVNKIVKELLG